MEPFIVRQQLCHALKQICYLFQKQKVATGILSLISRLQRDEGYKKKTLNMICIKPQTVWRHCNLTSMKTERKSKYCSNLPANTTNFLAQSAEALASGMLFLLIVLRVSAREAELSQWDAARI